MISTYFIPISSVIFLLIWLYSAISLAVFIELLPKNKLVVFTDGTPTKQKRVFNADNQFWLNVKLSLRDYVIEKSISGNAYYGYGWTK